MGRPSKMRWGRYIRDSSYIKLRWEWSFAINPTLAATAKTIGFSILGNSLDFVGAANVTALANTTINVNALYAPTGLTTMLNAYSQYKVFGSALKLRFLPGSAAGAPMTNPLWVILQPLSSAAAFPNDADIAGQFPYCKRALVTPAILTSARGYTLKSYMSTRKIQGISKAEFEGTSYLGSNGVAPPVVWEWIFQCCNFGQSNLPVADALTIHVTMDFYVKFYNRQMNVTA